MSKQTEKEIENMERIGSQLEQSAQDIVDNFWTLIETLRDVAAEMYRESEDLENDA